MSTLFALGQQPDAFIKKDSTDGHQHRIFDVAIAQTMTILSSLVYESHDGKATEAYRIRTNLDFRNKRRCSLKQVELEMKKLIWESERPTRKIARRYGLHLLV